MEDHAHLLMLAGVTNECPDCLAETIFVPADHDGDDAAAFCCTSCGAAVIDDPLLDRDSPVTQVA